MSHFHKEFHPWISQCQKASPITLPKQINPYKKTSAFRQPHDVFHVREDIWAFKKEIPKAIKQFEIQSLLM